mmetsp:Transcript_27882/g.61516  ORF Transcript_27882/g.61516 Transcript_27882/m.61516 type:complete len:243 (-) Transcript_27882:397-1125(-)
MLSHWGSKIRLPPHDKPIARCFCRRFCSTWDWMTCRTVAVSGKTWAVVSWPSGNMILSRQLCRVGALGPAAAGAGAGGGALAGCLSWRVCITRWYSYFPLYSWAKLRRARLPCPRSSVTRISTHACSRWTPDTRAHPTHDASAVASLVNRAAHSRCTAKIPLSGRSTVRSVSTSTAPPKVSKSRHRRLRRWGSCSTPDLSRPSNTNSPADCSNSSCVSTVSTSEQVTRPWPALIWSASHGES